MEIRFNVTGSARKELVGIISQVTGCKQVYKGMPSAAYEVADITISKDGTVSYDERTEESTIKAILEQTAAAGFAAELDEAPATETPEAPATAEANISAVAKDTGLVISFPADKVNLENLQKLLESKSNLIKKALEVEAFPIEEHDDQVSFPPCATPTTPSRTPPPAPWKCPPTGSPIPPFRDRPATPAGDTAPVRRPAGGQAAD